MSNHDNNHNNKVWFLNKDHLPVYVEEFVYLNEGGEAKTDEQVFEAMEKVAQELVEQKVALKWCDLNRCGFDAKYIKKYKLRGRKTEFMPFKSEKVQKC